MTRNTVFVVLTTVFLVGCASMAPTYQRPAAPVPAAWPEFTATDQKDGGPTATDLDWRAFYSDERLQRVIDLALTNNRDLKVAVLNIEKAEATYQIRRAELFPVVKGSGTMNRQRVPADVAAMGEASVSSQYTLNLGASAWEIDLFGRVRSLKDKALDQYLATAQAARSARIAMIAEVARVWLTLAADRESLSLAQSTLETAQAAYGVVESRYRVGVSSELDLRQAQITMEATRSSLVRSTRLVALDENLLSLLTGASVPRDLLPLSLDGVPVQKALSPGISSDVLLTRPDILQAEFQLKAAYANIGAARAAFFPRITLTGTLGSTSDQLSSLFKAGSYAWTFVPQISLPIFDGGSRRADLTVAQIERDIAVAQYEKAIQTAFREVSDALAEQANLGNQLAVQESLVAASREAYRLSEARYLKGIGTYLGVLDAARSLFAAQQELVTLRLAGQTNMATLYKVLGGGEQRLALRSNTE